MTHLMDGDHDHMLPDRNGMQFWLVIIDRKGAIVLTVALPGSAKYSPFVRQMPMNRHDR